MEGHSKTSTSKFSRTQLQADENLSSHCHSPPKVTVANSSNSRMTLAPEEPRQFSESISKALATSDSDLMQHLIRQINGVISGEDGPERKVNIGLAQLHDISPRDAIETMLAVQMIGVHSLAMKCMRKAQEKGQSAAGVDNNLNRANKLMRTFTAQMEALNRHRRGGQQNVVVEHVHVNSGGQAIVGALSEGLTKRREGG